MDATMMWHTMPRDAGQIVHVEYAADEDYLYRRTTDRSVPETMIERVAWINVDEYGDFEPWNGRLGARVGVEDWERWAA